MEPFVSQSYYRSHYFGNEKSLRLSDYFDIDVWNHKVVTIIPYATPLVKWEDFISKTAHQLASCTYFDGVICNDDFL